LYIGMGDGQADGDVMGLAQDNDSLLGKILRIDVDATDAGAYGIPPSNPYVGMAGARGEIWASGFRLPYRFSFDATTSDLYIGEVGDTRFEEINFEASPSVGGFNFGWPAIEGPTACHTPPSGCDPSGFTPPLHNFAHSASQCAVMAGGVYRGTALASCRQGRFYYADYCTGRIFSFLLMGGMATDLQPGPVVPAQVVSMGQGGDGELYLLDANGTIHHLVNGT
jgi:glucose/arabinose dehydrogenase